MRTYNGVMDMASFYTLLQESLFMIIVFGGFFFYTVSKGRQSITNLILGLYLALLITIEFPYFNVLLGEGNSAKTESIIILIVFVVFTVLSTFLFARLMPREYEERLHEGFWKKILLAGAATVLVMTFSYHALPVTELITPGSPINYLFASADSFFWWLLVPMGILFTT